MAPQAAWGGTPRCPGRAVDGLDHRERVAAEGVGHLRNRGEVHQPPDGGHLVRHVAGPLAPAVEDITGLLGGKEERACVDLAQRHQIELKGSDDAEASTATTQRPEQIRLVFGVDADLLSTHGDELDGGYLVTGEAVLAPVEADPTTKRVVGDADERSGAPLIWHPALPAAVRRRSC